MNGVINIITKPPADAPGVMVSSSADPEQGFTTTVRQGGQIGSTANYYIFGRAAYWEPSKTPSGGVAPDRLGLPQEGCGLTGVLMPQIRSP